VASSRTPATRECRPARSVTIVRMDGLPRTSAGACRCAASNARAACSGLPHATRIGRAATRGNAEVALLAVRRVGRRIPAKVACFEESTSAAVALALSGRHTSWRHGIASDPVRMHAWIEVDGQPVGEPPSTRRYTPLIRLP
jgi:hypothetical protein